MSPLQQIFTNRPPTVAVPDRRSRIIPEVVLVRRWAVGVLGIWRGEGLGEGWDKGGQFTSNLRPRWTYPVTARRVPSKQKGIQREREGELARGDKSKGNAPCIVVHCNPCPCIHRMPEVLEWYQLYIYIIITIGMNVVDNLNSVQVINKPCV